jgi:inorganic pyrophosphatase
MDLPGAKPAGLALSFVKPASSNHAGQVKEAAMRDFDLSDERPDPRPMIYDVLIRRAEDDGDVMRLSIDEGRLWLAIGILASTHADDSVPLEVLVLGDGDAGEARAAPVRLIGVVEADQSEKGRTAPSERILAVAADRDRFKDVRDIGDLGEGVIEALTSAWVGYNASRFATFQVTAWHDAAEARRVIEAHRPAVTRLARSPFESTWRLSPSS